jgi:hypothetical protein
MWTATARQALPLHAPLLSFCNACYSVAHALHCVLTRHVAAQGFVYLKFATVEGSAAAQKALHGRWFAGRQVVAEFQFTAVYGSYFKV